MIKSSTAVKISVILPAYNCESFISSAIECVINQTEEFLELIIVDDFSTDNTKAIIDEYSQKDDRIRSVFLDRNSGGPAKPRNIGLAMAKGKYVSFIDADDLWHREKISLQLNAMAKYDLGFSCTKVMKFKDTAVFSSFLEEQSSTLDLINLQTLLKKNIIAMSSVVIDLDKVKKITFSECKEHVAVEDYLAWLEIHQIEGLQSARLNLPLTHYRVRKDSISRSKFIMAVKVFNLLSKIKINGKKLGVKRFYYFFTYMIGSYQSKMYS